jgi:serine/threonine protein kinase
MDPRSQEEDDDSALARARVGTVVRGKYRIDRVLGTGGMATVYAATHRNQAEFAIKMLHPELSRRKEISARFLREGYAGNSVKHPGAVLVVDDDTAEDGSAFLVMEFLRGNSVEDLWERHGRKLPLTAVLALAWELLDVLAAAHDKAIVHRDIKPANLFVTQDGQFKVLDFGIAQVRNMATTNGSMATQAGTVLGTPAFMAPEQALGRAQDIDGRTDLFAVGATLFVLLTGRLVHPGENGNQLLIMAATSPAPPLSQVLPDIPAPVARLIDVALAFDRANRWQSASDMREAVREANLAVFGRIPSREPLATLVGARAHLENAATGGNITAISDEAIARASSNKPPAIPQTNTPVTMGATDIKIPTRSLAPFFAGGALLALLLVGGAVLFGSKVYSARKDERARNTSASTEAPGGAALPPTGSPPVPPQGSASVSAAALTASSTGAPTASTPAPPTPAAKEPTPTPAPTPCAPPRGGPSAAPAPALSAKPGPSTPVTDCAIPYVLNADGSKKWKTECLGKKQ